MHETTDEHLVKQALAGSQQAFRQIVERTQPMVYRVAFRFLGNLHEAEDAVQDVYVRVWNNLHKFSGKSRLTTWMYPITVNRCLDILKKPGHRHKTEELHVHSAAVRETPETDLEKAELMEMIREAAAFLTPKQKAVFILRDLEGLSANETGEMLKMSDGNIRSNLYHARRKIHEMIREKYRQNTQTT